MENVPDFIQQIIGFLNVPLFSLGGSTITIWVIIYLVIIMILLVYVTAKLKYLIIHRLLAKSSIEIGIRVAVASLVRYIILFIGFIVILQTAGVDLSSITVLFGALGVGIGFGLQNITNNFVKGYGIVGFDGSGVLAQTSQASINVVGNYFYECIGDIISMKYATDCVISSNYIFGAADSVIAIKYTGDKTFIESNMIIGMANTSTTAIWVSGDDSAVSSCSCEIGKGSS